jgi:hypothetical protein
LLFSLSFHVGSLAPDVIKTKRVLLKWSKEVNFEENLSNEGEWGCGLIWETKAENKGRCRKEEVGWSWKIGEERRKSV